MCALRMERQIRKSISGIEQCYQKIGRMVKILAKCKQTDYNRPKSQSRLTDRRRGSGGSSV
jgi:hypothetical protein